MWGGGLPKPVPARGRAVRFRVAGPGRCAGLSGTGSAERVAGMWAGRCGRQIHIHCTVVCEVSRLSYVYVASCNSIVNVSLRRPVGVSRSACVTGGTLYGK